MKATKKSEVKERQLLESQKSEVKAAIGKLYAFSPWFVEQFDRLFSLSYKKYLPLPNQLHFWPGYTCLKCCK